jgi:hypothetical protein
LIGVLLTTRLSWGDGSIYSFTFSQHQGSKLMARRILIAALMLMAAANTPSTAKSEHISCQLSGTLTNGWADQPISKTLLFYLDDTDEKLVSETNSVSAKTTLYSDAKIEGQLADVTFPTIMAPSLFGILLDGPEPGQSLFTLNRVGDDAILTAKFQPNGTMFATGPCEQIAPPKSKF